MDITNWDDNSLYQKFLAPEEDSPNKGSRDRYMQNAYGWGAENLGGLLRQNAGDPYGIFDTNAVQEFLNSPEYSTPPYMDTGGSNVFAGTPNRFTNFTLPQLQSYLSRQYNDMMAAGNPGNDAMWLPAYREYNGQPYVAYGQRNSSKGGLLDAFTRMAEPVFAWSGFSGPALGAEIAAGAAGAGATAAFDGMSIPGFGGGTGMSVPAANIGAIGAGMSPTTLAEIAAFGGGGAGAIGAGLGAGGSELLSGFDAFGMPSYISPEGLGLSGVDMTGFSQPFNISSLFDSVPEFGSPISGYGGVGGGYVGDFVNSMMPGGSMSAYGAFPGGGMVDLGGTGAISGAGLGEQSFLDKLMSKFGSQKDPLKLGAAVAQTLVNQKNKKQMQNAIKQAQQSGFPFQNYQYLAQQWADPLKRYEMLMANPAFRAAQDYIKQAQLRRNARTGDLNSGFGQALVADVLGKNAAAWDKQQFDQIKDITGMGFNSGATTASLAAQLYPQIAKSNMATAGSVFDAIRSNQGFFPDMLKTFF